MATNGNSCCQRLLNICFPSSTRWLILILSVAVIASLFANLQIFNLAVLYIQEADNAGQQKHLMLLPPELGGILTAKSSSVGTLNWGSPNEDDTRYNATTTTTARSMLASQKPPKLQKSKGKGEEKNEENKGQNSENGASPANISDASNQGKMNMPSKRKLRLHARKEKIRNNREVRTYADPEDLLNMEDMEEFNPQDVTDELDQAPGFVSVWAQAKIQRLAQSLLFSAPGITILIAHFPSYMLIRRYGAHKPILCTLLTSATITAAFPFILISESPLLLIMLARILLAICVAPTFSFLGQMSARWATVGEQHFFVLAGFLAIQFGPIISWVFTISLLRFDHISRLQVFGFHSSFCLLLALIWLFFYRDQPQKHQMVNGEELNNIVSKKPRSGHPFRLPTTLFCVLLRSTSAWACWIASFCYFYALLSLHIFYPIFMYKVLHQSIQKSIIAPFGLLCLAHLLFHLFISFGPANLCRPATWKVRVFNSCGFALSALMFIAIAILPRDNENLRHLWLLWFCLLPLGATSLGFIKSIAVTGGGHFAQYIVSHMQLAFGLAYAILPTLLYSSMNNQDSIVHWRLLFLSCSLALLLGMTIFLILGRGTPTSLAEQWSQDAQADAPLILIKFSPIHRPPPATTE